MIGRNLTKTGVAVLVAVPVLMVGGYLVLKPDHKTTTTTSSPSSSTTATTTSGASTSALIDTASFKYEIPANWVQMKKEVLDKIGATSGIGSVANLTAIFKTSVSTSVPKDDNDLKNNTLNDVKKSAPHFVLIASVATKVDGHSGQKFTYSFTDKDGNNKLRQQMSAIPYKGKTYFLVASSNDDAFDKQSGDFDKILGSFKFK